MACNFSRTISLRRGYEPLSICSANLEPASQRALLPHQPFFGDVSRRRNPDMNSKEGAFGNSRFAPSERIQLSANALRRLSEGLSERWTRSLN